MSGDPAASRSYVYDLGAPGNGNRTEERDGNNTLLATASYDSEDRMLTYGAASYQYTAAGELMTRSTPADTFSTAYDALGNLVSAGHKEANTSGPTSPVTVGTVYGYQVDGANRRVRKLVNEEPVQGWLYRDGLAVVAELDGAGALLNRYVYATHSHVPDLLIRGGVTYRVVTDHLGSVRAIVNVANGAEVQRRRYDAWGVLKEDTDSTFQSLGYAGGIQDRDTKLVRFGARDYDPAVGRWTAKDPIVGFGMDANPYAYALSSPMVYHDPDGRSPKRSDALDDPMEGIGKITSGLAQLRDSLRAVADAYRASGIPDNRVNRWEHARFMQIASCRYGKRFIQLVAAAKEWQDLIQTHFDWTQYYYDNESNRQGFDGQLPRLNGFDAKSRAQRRRHGL